MKQKVLRRLETLEGKAADDIQVEAVFFYVVDGRKGAIEESEPVQKWLFPPLVIDRLPSETDELFTDRATREARKTMKNQFALPCLFSN